MSYDTANGRQQKMVRLISYTDNIDDYFSRFFSDLFIDDDLQICHEDNFCIFRLGK